MLFHIKFHPLNLPDLFLKKTSLFLENQHFQTPKLELIQFSWTTKSHGQYHKLPSGVFSNCEIPRTIPRAGKCNWTDSGIHGSSQGFSKMGWWWWLSQSYPKCERCVMCSTAKKTPFHSFFCSCMCKPIYLSAPRAAYLICE